MADPEGNPKAPATDAVQRAASAKQVDVSTKGSGWFAKLVEASRVPEGGLTAEEANSHRAGTADRNAGISNVAYHNFTSTVGAGVLALPAVMAALGWGAGAVTLFLSWFISWMTYVFLVRLHEQGDPPDVRRMDRYPQLTQYAFGKKIGTWTLTPFQLILFIGIPIAYTITAAESLQTCAKLLAPGSPWGGTGGGLSRWIVLFSILQLAVVQVRSFRELSWVSLIGAVASVFYILVAFICALVEGKQPGVTYSQPAGWTSPTDRLFGVFNALATAAFAYGGHIIACEIQATLPMPPSSVRRMLTSVHVTFFLTAACYFSVAITGFWAFGSGVNILTPNILTTLSRPVGVIVAANLAVFFNVMAGYHLHIFPLIDMADGAALKHGILPSSLLWRLLLRTLFVAGVALIACAVPFFGVVLGFLGAISITPTTFMMPCALWLKLKKPTTKDWRLYFCWATLAVMSAVTVLGAVGAVFDFIKEVVFGHGAKPFEW